MAEMRPVKKPGQMAGPKPPKRGARIDAARRLPKAPAPRGGVAPTGPMPPVAQGGFVPRGPLPPVSGMPVKSQAVRSAAIQSKPLVQAPPARGMMPPVAGVRSKVASAGGPPRRISGTTRRAV